MTELSPGVRACADPKDRCPRDAQRGLHARANELSGRFGKARVTLPVKYRDLSGAVLMFAVPAKNARALLPDPRLWPIGLADDLALLGVCAFDYRECDIAPYLEAGIVVPCRMMSDDAGEAPDLEEPILHYIHSLPVTTEEAMALGRDVWEFPKTVGPISLTIGSNLSVRFEAPGHYRLSIKARLETPQNVAKRIRLRPLLAGDTINLAHVAIEAVRMVEVLAEGVELESDVSGESDLDEALQQATFVEGYVIDKGSALLSAPLESFERY